MRGLIGFLFALVLVYMGVITPEGLESAGDFVAQKIQNGVSH
jgi:hypothetical protein